MVSACLLTLPSILWGVVYNCIKHIIPGAHHDRACRPINLLPSPHNHLHMTRHHVCNNKQSGHSVCRVGSTHIFACTHVGQCLSDASTSYYGECLQVEASDNHIEASTDPVSGTIRRTCCIVETLQHVVCNLRPVLKRPDVKGLCTLLE